MKASETKNPQEIVAQAFTLYNDVYHSLPRLPIQIFPKAQNDFSVSDTIIAVSKNEILGVATFKLAQEFKDTQALFGENASDVFDRAYSQDHKPLYRIGNIAVSQTARGQGVATQLYAFASDRSKGKCIAAITENNKASILAANKAGFEDMKQCHYISKLSFDRDRPVLNDNGQYVLSWFLMKATSPDI